jgi:hypothetical protein
MVRYIDMRELDAPYVPRFMATTGEFASILDEYMLREVGAEVLLLAAAEETVEDEAMLEMNNEALEEYAAQVTAESNTRPRTPTFQVVAAREAFEHTARRLFGKVNQHSLWYIGHCSLALTNETHGRMDTPKGAERLHAACDRHGKVTLSRYGALDIEEPTPPGISLEVSDADVQTIVSAIDQLERVNSILPRIV